MSNIMETVVVIDVESGGLSPEHDAVLQVALVASGGRSLSVDVCDEYGVCHDEAMGINKIDRAAHMRSADNLRTAAYKIDSWLRAINADLPEGEQIVIGGHNTGFDIAMIRRIYAITGSAFPVSWYRSIDTQTLLFQLRLKGEIPPTVQGLNNALAHFGITHPGEARHTALGDAVATRALLCHLLNVKDR